MMDFLKPLIARINNYFYFTVQINLGFLEQTKIVPLTIRKAGANNFFAFWINYKLTFNRVSLLLA